MSSREHLIKLAQAALASTALPNDVYNFKACAEAVVNALMPQITDAKQMRGVPEDSILLYSTQNGVRALTWQDGKLWSSTIDFDPAGLIKRYGPLTVVSMP